MRFVSAGLLVVLISTAPVNESLNAQSSPAATSSSTKNLASGSVLSLRAVSTKNVESEAGGAFMSGSKCDPDGNLYIRKYSQDRPLLGPVVKIDSDGKRTALFDPSSFSQLALDRADAFTPASDGGLFQIAQSGIVKPHIYVLHFSSDGTLASPTRLDADFEVYTFAAFVGGNFLISGVKRDVQNKDDRGQNFTAVFSADGRELTQLSFQKPAQKSSGASDAKTGTPSAGDPALPTLDLSEAEPGEDGNLYVMRRSSPALVYVISASGKIEKTLKIVSGLSGAMPSAFHVSANRLAISFWNDHDQSQTMVVADAQTGQKIATYAASSRLGPQLACYSANGGVFTFLKLGEGNSLQVIRAEAQ